MSDAAAAASPTPANPKRFGWFLGVFTPTLLTVLGVIMYLRLGWVVGNAGLVGAVVIILVSNLITLATALSMSTLATNMRVGVGGAYFLISRSFGLEVGGAIGIPLYLSQVLSVTLYAYGLAESFKVLWDDIPIMPTAAVVVVIVGAVASRSTELTLKLQLPIMALILLSLVALSFGVEFGGSSVPAVGDFTSASPVITFAVFFPAVT
ncbi:MAG: Na-K-Cl cotransporter, partial [Rhodobacterales bacterium]|nr:Na-K-Cl cotransporter [Rhodobacterales bacterium]